MLTDAARHVSPTVAVQTETDGLVFPVDCWTRLHRFLFWGNEGGSYYAAKGRRVLKTVDCIDDAISENYRRAVDTIVDVSCGGQAPRNDHAIFALAYIAGHYGGNPTRYALSKLSDVCRISTHLFDFCAIVQQFRGWGRGLREAVSRWYLNRSPQSLAMQVTKYPQRNGWSHRDVLRKVHPQAIGLTDEVLQYVTQREDWRSRKGGWPRAHVTQFLSAVEEAKTTESKSRLLGLIVDYGLVREHIPTTWLNDANVWDALLEKMPLHTVIRNLGKITSVGLLMPFSIHANHVVNKLIDPDTIKAARLHPLDALIAKRQYAGGRSDRGSLSWSPNSWIIAALERAFYLGFDAIKPTGKNFLLGVDVSESMVRATCAGAPISCYEAAAVMAMVAVRTEPHTRVLGFCHTPVDLEIAANDSLQAVTDKVQKVYFGDTDCVALIDRAFRSKWEVDVFCVYTDWLPFPVIRRGRGRQHVAQALRDYRQGSGRRAKLAAFQLGGGSSSITDPSDAGMMNFNGFDTATPSILTDFALQK